MSLTEQERLEENVRRTVGMHAMRQVRGLVDEELRMEAAGERLLRSLLRHGWIALLPTALLLAHYLGMF